MKRLYQCPHCRGVLNPNVKVILAARYKKRDGLILLSPQPGNFKFLWDEEFGSSIPEGAAVSFRCPLCTGDLTSPTSQKFVHLLCTSPGGAPARVEFSRVHGHHATFVITDEEVTPYGEDAAEHESLNFFGA